MKQVLVIVAGATVLSGCALGATARIDPPKVVTYHQARCQVPDPPQAGGKDKKDKEKDKEAKRKRRPINLDCFRFPEINDQTVIYGTITHEIAVQTAAPAPAPAAPAPAPAAPLPAVAALPPAAQPAAAPPSPPVMKQDINIKIPTAYAMAVYDPVSRNRLAAILLKHSDDQCARENGTVVGRETTVNLILDLLTTGLTSAATIVTGEQADSILTGLGAFSAGARGHVSNDVYRGQITQAITAAIAGEQSRIRQEIEKQRGSDVATFTVDDMIRQVNQYYQACSFYKGLELVLTSAAAYPKLAATQESQALRIQEQELELKLAAADEQLTRHKATLPADSTIITADTASYAQLSAQLKAVRDRIAALRAGPAAPQAPTP